MFWAHIQSTLTQVLSFNIFESLYFEKKKNSLKLFTIFRCIFVYGRRQVSQSYKNPLFLLLKRQFLEQSHTLFPYLHPGCHRNGAFLFLGDSG